MGAKLDRATHYLFGSAFYIILAEIISKKYPVIFSLNNIYDFFKAYLEIEKIETTPLSLIPLAYYFGMSIMFTIGLFLGIIAMRIAVLPDSLDKPHSIEEIGEVEEINEDAWKHRKFGHSTFFIIILTFFFYLIFYILEIAFPFGFFTFIGINFSFMVFTSLLSHLILDSLTFSGVPLFYPISKRYFSLKLIKSGSLWMLIIILISFYIIVNFFISPLLKLFMIILLGGKIEI